MSSDSPIRQTVAFVIPWYGEDIPGGAEAECRALAKALRAARVRTEVLTTCVREFRSDWSENYHAEGESIEGGVVVRRFRVRPRDQDRFAAVNAKLMEGLTVSPEEECVYVGEMINSPALYEYIGAHREEYLFFFIPYMFGTTFWGSQVCPDRSFLIPCLHDEIYARMGVFRSMFQRVRGIVFHSPEEWSLAVRLYGIDRSRGAVLGEPVDCGWRGDADCFEHRYGLRNFLLYAGRTDKGKNAELLIEYFSRMVEETGTRMKLVFIGGADLPVPGSNADGIVTLGFLSQRDKQDCYAAALATCIPSVVESFSLAMMESWVAGRPVIVHERCPVTTGFCRWSNGGLWFSSYDEFREIVRELVAKPELAAILGKQGCRFVTENYSPPVVAERYIEALRKWLV